MFSFIIIFSPLSRTGVDTLGDAWQCLKSPDSRSYLSRIVFTVLRTLRLDFRLAPKLVWPSRKVSKCPGDTDTAGETGVGRGEVPGLPALVDT